MKLSKRTSRTLIATFIAASFFGALLLVQSYIQIVGGLLVEGEDNASSVGIMRTGVYTPESSDADNFEPITVIAGEDGQPEIIAKPTQVLLYSANEGTALPDHWGFKAWKVQFYLRTLLLLAMVVMLGWFAINTVRGARLGSIFTQTNLGLLYALAPVTLLFMAADENIYLFKQLAIYELYADQAQIGLHAALRLDASTFIIPLLIIVVAQLYKIAIGLNEDETMTV